MNRGYSILELVISMAITIFATLVITKFFITEHRLYAAQEADAEMYQTLRGAITMLSGEMRLAGYGVPSGMDAITAVDSTEIEFRTNLRNIRSVLSSGAASGENMLYVTSGTGRVFEQGDVIMICKGLHADACEEHRLQRDGTNDSITLTSSLNTAFPEGSRIELINTIAYRYNRGRQELQRKIDRGGWETVAENIAEDGLVLSCRDQDNNVTLNASEVRGIDITLIVQSIRGDRRANATSSVALRNSLQP